MTQTPQRKVHLLVAGIILFRPKDSEQLASMPMNALLVQETTDVNVAALARGQQAIQMQFHNAFQDPTIEIVNVVITNIVNLGNFTQDEFHKAPEGMTLQQQQEGIQAVQEAMDQQKATEAAAKPKTPLKAVPDVPKATD